MEDGLLSRGERAPADEPAPGHPDLVVERLRDGTLAATARDVTIAVGRGGPGLTSVELLLAALGSCTLGTMLDYARRVGVDVDGARAELAPVLETHPERITEIRVTLTVSGDISEPRLAALRRVAGHCKLHTTLAQGLSVALTVERGDA